MTTNDITVPISLSQGLDTKTDDKQVVQGKLLELENGVFTKVGAINKRHGLDQFPTAGIAGLIPTDGYTDGYTPIHSGDGIAVFNDELLLFADNKAYAFSEATDTWSDKGKLKSIAFQNRQILRTDNSQANPDSASLHGVTVIAWEDSRGGVRYSVIDTETGTFLVSDALVRTDAARPRVRAFNDRLYIFYVNRSAPSTGGHLFYRSVNPKTYLILDTQVSAASDLHVNNDVYDLRVIGHRMFLAYGASDGTHVRTDYFTEAMSLETPLDITDGYPAMTLSLFPDANENVWCTYINRLGAVRAFINNYANVNLVPLKTLTTDGYAVNVTGVVTNSTSGGVANIFWDTNPTNDANYLGDTSRYINKCTLTVPSIDPSTAVTSSVSIIARSLGLVSEAFFYNDAAYVAAVHNSTLQSTQFIIDSAGAVVGKISPHTSGAPSSNRILCQVEELGSGQFSYANTVKTKLTTLNSTDGTSTIAFTPLGLNITTLDFERRDVYTTAKINNNLLSTGGIIQSYDGLSFTEHGFAIYPEGTVTDSQPFTLVEIAVGGTVVLGHTLHEITDVWTISGNRITGGQFFQIGAGIFFYDVWFKVDGVGVPPASVPIVTGATAAIEVDILSTDSPLQVATKLATRLNGYATADGYAYTATVPTPGVAIARVTAGAATSTAPSANYTAPYGVGTNGNLSIGSYQYVAVYEWTDNFGQIQRSTTSEPVTAVISISGQSCSLRIPTLRITNKVGARGSVRIVLYRTEADGILFHRITSIISPIVNDPTVDSAVYLDNLSDAALIANDYLYTSGGVLDFFSPPSANIMVAWGNRIVLAGTEEPNRLFYSQLTGKGEAVGFSEELTIDVDSRGGDITALGVMDEKLIIFKHSSIFQMAGDGADNTGQNSSILGPVLVTSDAGCTNPNSVVTTSSGLMFQSGKGIYLLDRGGQVQYIGAAVEAFNEQTITSATLVPDTNQVRFTCSDGNALVYDYFFNQWSTFTNYRAVDSAVWKDRFVFVRSNGSIWKENDTFLDGSSYIKLRLVTSWLQFAGLQNFQRVKKVNILGDYKGKHKLWVQFSFDFNPSFIDDTIIDAFDLCDPGFWGDGDTWGSDSVWGGEFPLYQFSITPTKQKCQAMRISIEDVQSSDYNEGFSLSALTLLVGQKKGLFKGDQAKSMGNS